MVYHEVLYRDEDPDLHLLVEGQRISRNGPDADGVIFAVSRPSHDVRLRSRSERPGKFGIPDDRLLGFCLQSLTLNDGSTVRHVQAAELAEAEGFYGWEPPGQIWTNGDAVLPAGLFEGFSSPLCLTINGFGMPNYPVYDEASDPQVLFRGFLSLGPTCDFAFAQSHFDAEPIDLLRWASTDLERVISGLRNRFAGLGDPADVTLALNPEGTEYRLIDSRYASFHTMVFEGLSADQQDELRLRDCRRLAFLRRKLLHDLGAGQRIAVFKFHSPDTPIAAAHDLLAALRSIGPSALLILAPATGASTPGGVTAHGDGLFVGNFDPLATELQAFAHLRSICARTRSLLGATATHRVEALSEP